MVKQRLVYVGSEEGKLIALCQTFEEIDKIKDIMQDLGTGYTTTPQTQMLLLQPKRTFKIYLKCLRAGNRRVLFFAHMTKMLNIIEISENTLGYMNYRKYKYFRLDGSSTIMDRRDMVKDFQHR